MTTTRACSWLLPITNCVSTDTACICSVVELGTASQYTECLTYEQSVDIAFANDITDLHEKCPSPVTVSSTRAATGTTATGDPCVVPGGACIWLKNLDSCATKNLACICDVFAATGTQVSICVTYEQAVNATIAAEIIELKQRCLLPSSTSPRPTADPCINGACDWLRGITTCAETDIACFCRVYSAAGGSQISSCVNCEEGFNITFASEIEAIGSQCLTPTPVGNAPVGGIRTSIRLCRHLQNRQVQVILAQ